MVIYLTELLQPIYKVSILSRGYGRNTKGYVLLNGKQTASEVGDEPLNYFQKFSAIQVAVSEDRVQGYQQLMKEDKKTDVLLLDDAFQHLAFSARMNILVTPFDHLYINDYLLPSGRLREPRLGAKRAQIIIVSKCPLNITESQQELITAKLQLRPNQNVFFTTLQYGDLYHFQNGIAIENLQLKERSIYLFSGIGNNTPIIDYLKPRCQHLEVKTYPDHYAYKSTDIEALHNYAKQHPGTIFITTEKDAMRLAAFKTLKERLALSLYILPVNVTFTMAKAQNQFNQIILNYVRQNQSHS